MAQTPGLERAFCGHKFRLLAEHRSVIESKTIHVLDIPDDYRYMDPELVEQLQTSVGEILGLL